MKEKKKNVKGEVSFMVICFILPGKEGEPRDVKQGVQPCVCTRSGLKTSIFRYEIVLMKSFPPNTRTWNSSSETRL